MLTEEAVLWSATPISSAIAMKRLLNTSSMTGSTSVPIAREAARGTKRVRMRLRVGIDLGLPAGFEDGGGGGIDDEGRALDECRRGERSARSKRGRSSPGRGGGPRRRRGGGVCAGLQSPAPPPASPVPLPRRSGEELAVSPTASTIAVSITTSVSSATKPNRARCIASNSARIAIGSAIATSRRGIAALVAKRGPAAQRDMLHPLGAQRRLGLHAERIEQRRERRFQRLAQHPP